MEYLIVAITAVGLIVPVELPDKTFVATLVLATRFPPLPVWAGVVAAFGVQCLVAVTAGHLLSRLPAQPVAIAAAALFAVGAVVLVRGARRTATVEEQEEQYVGKLSPGMAGRRAALTSFLVLFTAEWGDLSQLLTAGLVASGRPGLPVFVGSWLALAAVSGAAVLLGRWLMRRVRLALIRYAGAAVCAVLAVATVIGVLG